MKSLLTILICTFIISAIEWSIVGYTFNAKTSNALMYSEEPTLPYAIETWQKRRFFNPENLNNFNGINENNANLNRQESKNCSCASRQQHQAITTDAQLKEQGMHDDIITE